jgi:hypothetical protein
MSLKYKAHNIRFNLDHNSKTPSYINAISVLGYSNLGEDYAVRQQLTK